MTDEPNEPGEAGEPPTVAPAGRGMGRILVAAVVLLLVVGGGATYLLTRSAGDGEGPGAGPRPTPGPAPVTASKGDFCDRYADLVGVDDGLSVRDWADAMARVGTPAGVPADVRAGFVVVLAKASEVDPDATVDDLTKQDASLSDADADDLETFTQYATTTCASELERAVREAASDELQP